MTLLWSWFYEAMGQEPPEQAPEAQGLGAAGGLLLL